MSAAAQIGDFLAHVARPVRLTPIFPFYIAHRIKRGLLSEASGVTKPDADFPGADVGEIESLGDCRYAMTVTDANGTRYRVTVDQIERA